MRQDPNRAARGGVPAADGRPLLFAVAVVGLATFAWAETSSARPGAARPSRTAATRPAADPAEAVDARFVQVAPAGTDPTRFARSRGQGRAVILVHGYWLHFKKDKISHAVLKDWQEPRSPLVAVLAQGADVFAFAYGQNVAVEQVAHHRTLTAGIAQIRRLGYREIVLVGHSAGGLVARLFVEDFPDAGVTKVVQVCAPNGGCTYADPKWVPKVQKTFVASLSPAGREKCLHDRTNKRIPRGVEFVCVLTAEDMVVPRPQQWTRDLQDQGVPAIQVPVGHRQIMRKTTAAAKLAEVIRTPHPRWTPVQVAEARQELLKPKKPARAPRTPAAAAPGRKP